MVDSEKKNYWLVDIENFTEELYDVTIRELRDTILKGLKRNIKYISIITPDGENRMKVIGHVVDDIIEEEWIEVYDENGELDHIETADIIAKDFLDNRVIIIMRFEKDMYDVLGEDKGWLNGILSDKD